MSKDPGHGVKRKRAAERRLSLPSLADLALWGVSFAVAVGLWAFVNIGERTSERTLRARLDLVDLPNGMVITSAVPDHVEVRIAGSGLVLSSIDAQRVRTTVDLGGVRPGSVSYALTSKDFSLPRSVQVRRVTPSRVSLDVERIGRRDLPVHVAQIGELDPNLELSEVKAVPSRVAVSGPMERLGKLRRLVTQDVDLARIKPGVNEIEVDLATPGGLMQLERRQVRVRLVAKEHRRA